MWWRRAFRFVARNNNNAVVVVNSPPSVGPCNSFIVMWARNAELVKRGLACEGKVNYDADEGTTSRKPTLDLYASMEKYPNMRTKSTPAL